MVVVAVMVVVLVVVVVVVASAIHQWPISRGCDTGGGPTQGGAAGTGRGYELMPGGGAGAWA